MTDFDGAPGRARTCNPQIRSLVLYPLSYGRGAAASGGVRPPHYSGFARLLAVCDPPGEGTENPLYRTRDLVTVQP